MIDHTPDSDIAGGEVVVIEGLPYVAHRPIASGVLGALAAEGGVYDLVKDGTSGPDIADGESVAWIAGSNLATDVITGNVLFGTAVGDWGASSAKVRVLHRPIPDTANESA
jgi:predicted RecA/RadA family phage recombinase